MSMIMAMAIAMLSGQPAPIDPPLVNRPDAFSNLVGAYNMRVTAAPTDVRVEEPILLRVTITGDGPAKYEPNRKYLKLFPANFERDFYVQEIRDEHQIDPKKKSWSFVFRLKPKHDKVESIDGITLVYYNPQHAGQNKFITVFADAIPIRVRPAADADNTPFALEAPASFFAVADSRDVLARAAPVSVSVWQWALVLALAPFLCFAAVAAWRRWGGDGASRGQRRRRFVAESLISRLHVNVAPWNIVRLYLEQCFGFPAQDATPAEVADFLKRRGFAKAVCAQARAFFERCDAERFSSDKAKPHTSEEAVRLIQALEADPCARG